MYTEFHKSKCTREFLSLNSNAYMVGQIRLDIARVFRVKMHVHVTNTPLLAD